MAYRRRVQVTGGGTFLVTLPKEWADRMGVGQGSEMILVPNDSGAMLVVPEGVRDRNKCSLVMTGREQVHLQRDIIARYIAGYDVIEVVGDRIGSEGRRIVREIAQSLVGVEVLAETQGAVALHCIANVRDFPAPLTIRRILEIADAMWDDAVVAFLTRDEELASDVEERDGDVDRLVLLVARQFGLLLRDLIVEEEVGMSRFEFLHYHTVADQLERVADHAVKVSRAARSLGEVPSSRYAERARKLADGSQDVVREAVVAFTARDVARANRVLAEKGAKEATTDWMQEAVRAQRENALPLTLLHDSLLRCREHGFNIAETALDASVPALDTDPI
ncbi:MAG TPA: phosphate uptake regulator PhoU [Candidatus Bipolaricaulis sp.]|nr:phosphate uptake regulator PhoU [Candidatus Bipolaricaulis sp.]HRS13657.1 phosphate uptake regulator PhoU [Candidatus Bipolaricaulis sp.]HRU21635.1 phosphate uptake regulator PhoU [Candidatus Bipolaricaulis sp.]